MASKKQGFLPGKITTKPKRGQLVCLAGYSRTAYFDMLRNGELVTDANSTLVRPLEPVLFLENVRDTKDKNYSWDCILYRDTKAYILNDYPRTEKWMEIA